MLLESRQDQLTLGLIRSFLAKDLAYWGQNNVTPQGEDDCLRAIRPAERHLQDFRTNAKEAYAEGEPQRAKRLPVETFTSID
jgi:hypothetical protein